jgi:hypothetical protein
MQGWTKNMQYDGPSLCLPKTKSTLKLEWPNNFFFSFYPFAIFSCLTLTIDDWHIWIIIGM